MSNMFKGKVCSITGSSSGIGLGLAKELLRRDANKELAAPEEALTIDQAALEILEGVEAGLGILRITDFGRAMYGKHQDRSCSK
jgi:NAD(P)-dependent dehydrogenase (short-subunit alcohol dehydrogenase family)